ncbi:MAG TPA: hypothetical protein VKT32_11960 [Chthonomonadaceae bacterium]|nr:hypothetical protein [Chthonomonadaceae bacterium]
MRQATYIKQCGPSYVYIKYRCSRCKKLGEHFVKQEEWEESLLQEATCEVTDKERTHFDTLGSITLDEMRQFHYELEQLNTLPSLRSDESEERG